MPEPALHSLFATPLLQWETGEEDLRQALLKDVLQRRNGARALGAECVAVGWFEGGDPHHAPLADLMQAALQRFLAAHAVTQDRNAELPRFSAWGTVRLLNRGDFVELRDSGQADLSGFLFLDQGDGAEEQYGGFLEFIDPRTGVKTLPGQRPASNARIDPQTGLLLLFPASTKRLFYPYEGDKPRIFLEFDLRFGPSAEDEDWTGARE